MARIARSTRSTREDLPDPCAETRQLRQIIRNLESEIEDACEDLDYLAEHTPESLAQKVEGIRNDLRRALDGGGERS